MRNAVATRALAQELRTFSAAMERIRKRRRRGRPATPSTLTEALELLADFYQEATGKRPTVVTRERPGGRGYGAVGPSLAFAEAAIAPLFPDAGSLVDDWRKVIKKMQAESRRISCFGREWPHADKRGSGSPIGEPTSCPPILPNLSSRRPSRHHRRHLDPAGRMPRHPSRC